MKKILLFLMMCISVTAFAAEPEETPILDRYKKIFSEPGEIIKSQGKFYLHEGNNVWYQVTEGQRKYERQWKCPYCFRFYRYGEKCRNPDCPKNQWY